MGSTNNNDPIRQARSLTDHAQYTTSTVEEEEKKSNKRNNNIIAPLSSPQFPTTFFVETIKAKIIHRTDQLDTYTID